LRKRRCRRRCGGRLERLCGLLLLQPLMKLPLLFASGWYKPCMCLRGILA
jgi:hypothetical protein